MKIETPYLLFLGAAQDHLQVKIANSVVDWRPDACIGEVALPACKITKGLPQLNPAEAAERGARTFVIAANNGGGYIEERWVPVVLEALDAGLDVAAGLHERLVEHPEISARASETGGRLIDVRHTAGELPIGEGEPRSGKRLLTVGTDCSVGKMYTALALERELLARGADVRFVATGQCGIFVSGGGIAIDAVVADFISGAAEVLTPDADPGHWDIVEGQGSLAHPSYAGVTLGLLHGSQPDALVLCHAEGRERMRGLPDFAVPGLAETMELNLRAARQTNKDAHFVGISVNTSDLAQDEALAALARHEAATGLPCVDPVRTGVSAIVDRLLDEPEAL